MSRSVARTLASSLARPPRPLTYSSSSIPCSPSSFASSSSSSPSASSSSSSSLLHCRRSFSTSCPTRARASAKNAALQVESAPTAAVAEPTDVRVGEVYGNRLEDVYADNLADDLLYLTYSHKLAISPELPHPNPTWLEMEPYNRYAINRPRPPPKGVRKSLIPIHHNTTAVNVPRLEKIVLNIWDKGAIKSKASLLGCFHALRTITGQVHHHAGDRHKDGVTLLRAKVGVANFGIRAGMPMGAKVVLEGPEMYRFIETLTEFVFPRMREWHGLRLHHGKNENREDIASTSGVVSFGFEPAVMAFFPQIDACIEAYNKLYGCHVNFVTNQRGRGAQDRARKLLSGFRVPFYRPDFVYTKGKSGKRDWSKKASKLASKKK